MSKVWYLLLLVIVSCGIGNKNIKKTKNKNLELYTMVYNINSDSLFVKTSIVFPASNLVFIKKNNQFEASIETSIRLEEVASGKQIKRISNINKIIKKYYEDTRASDLHELEYQFYLLKGDYKVLVGVKDLDSFNNWTATDNINNSSKNVTLFTYEGDQKKYLIDGTLGQDNELWIELSNHLFDSNSYRCSIMKDNTILKSYNISDCIENENSLLECPIEIPNDIFGDITVDIVSVLSKKVSLDVYRDKETSLWSSDIDVVLGVMAYILPYSEIKSLYALSEDEQLSFVMSYIDNKDLDLKTNKNEFLELIKVRFQYVNDNFSEYNIGWKTDRGEVYIVNGPPKSIEVFYDNNNMVNKQIWYYEDRTFMFSDERTMGELKLMKI
ncbi:MAG: hypothetical protein CMF82_03930 [Candidatus Marinimicrobia bacterium]|nr:hypothetical protein [Candidatus Neomarinimicrobiota bacterium]